MPIREQFQRRAPNAQRKRSRSRRDEIDRERRELWDKTQREVDEIVTEFHQLLPRDKANSIGAIYARYSTRFQDSIGDQVRTVLREAVNRGIFVPREYIFVDLAVRGCKNDRAGLNDLRKVLDAKKVQAVLFFATNRLFRKVHKALEFVDKVVKELGIRCIFVKSGVDSADTKRWGMLMSFNSMMDEFVVSMYADNIRAAHEGLLEKRLVFGTISFGFAGEPIEGQFTRRRKPRCRLIVDPVASKVVEQIFIWYVRDGVRIDEIVRRLNDDPNIPLPPRCTSDAWNHGSVRKVLSNARYRGLWQYGVMEAVFLSSKDYTRQTPRAEPLKEIQIEELRIVPDELWYAAQEKLSSEPNNGGRKPNRGKRRTPPRILNRFFVCPEHDQILYVGGAHGQRLFCKICKGVRREQRPLYSQLHRDLALKLTCEKLANLVVADEKLIEDSIAACQDKAAAAQRPDPQRLASLRSQEAKLTSAIQFVQRNPGDTEADHADSQKSLREFRQERAKISAEIAALTAAHDRKIEIPTAEDIRDRCSELHSVLQKAAAGEEPCDATALREIVELLTGGRIELFQRGERKAKRGWLQGRFRVHLLNAILPTVPGASVDNAGEGTEVVIDYIEPESSTEESDRAFELYSQGVLNIEIARQLGCSKSKVTKLLKQAFERRGEPIVDGRSRRSTLEQKHSEPPMFQEIAEKAKALYDRGLLLFDIAGQLGCDRNTITSAIAYWHTSRGLPVPDGRTRRKALPGNNHPAHPADELGDGAAAA